MIMPITSFDLMGLMDTSFLWYFLFSVFDLQLQGKQHSCWILSYNVHSGSLQEIKEGNMKVNVTPVL